MGAEIANARIERLGKYCLGDGFDMVNAG